MAKMTTVEQALKAVKKNGEALERVPDELKTAEVCLEAVKKDIKAFQYVPEKLIAESPKEFGAICHEEVKMWGWELEYVPLNLKTAELCLEAVKQSGLALQYVPENHKTAEMCLKAVKQDGSYIQYVPEKLKTAKLCLEAIRQYGWALENVPDELKTAELCLEAVKKDGEALEYVPEKLKTLELCLEALKEQCKALEYVPEKLKTAEMCLDAVKIDGSTLEFVPRNLRTAEMCLEVVNYFVARIHKHETAQDRYGAKNISFEKLHGEITRVFNEMPEELREEMYRRLKNESGWGDGRESCSIYSYSTRQYVAEINIKALTQEAICFELDKVSEKKSSGESDFVMDHLNIFVTIPYHREAPKSITLKLTNIGKTAEQREAVINCNGRFAKAELEGIVILYAAAGKPRPGYRYRQKAEITLNFENRSETLICPINRTTTFNICFYDDYERQSRKPASVGDINEFLV